MKIKEPSIGGFDYGYSMDTIRHADELPVGTVAEAAHLMGMRQGEPLIVMMDCLLKYALVYKHRFGARLANDGVLGEPWLDAAKGVRALLNGDGVVAMEREITTDSKDNGAIEATFWDALNAAGYSEKDL